MSNTTPESASVLLHLATCFMDGNPASVKAMKLVLSQMDARAQQVYITNLKKLLTEYPLFSMRVNEKAYIQVMAALNELLKDGLYKARKSE